MLKTLDELPGGQVREGLGGDMLSYVLRGEPAAVLTEIAQLPQVGEHLHVTGYHYGDEDHALYEGLRLAPPAAALRWARLLEASVGNYPHMYVMHFAGGVHWPEVLLMHAAGRSVSVWSSERPKAKSITAAQMEHLLTEAGFDAASLIISAFSSPVSAFYGAEQRLLIVADLEDYAQAVARHIDKVRPLLAPAALSQRLHVLRMLDRVAPDELAKLAPELSALGVSGSKQVRMAAESLIVRCPDAMMTPLQKLAVHGTPEQRVNALRLIRTLADKEQNDAWKTFARDTALADKAPTAQALIKEWDAPAAPARAAPAVTGYAVPAIDWSGALTSPIAELLTSLWRELNASIDKANEFGREHHERMKTQGHNYAFRPEARYSDAELKALRDYLASADARWSGKSRRQESGWQHFGPLVQKVATTEGVTPVVLLKMLIFFALLTDQNGRLTYQATNGFDAMHRATGRPRLLELGEMMKAAGYPPDDLVRTYCRAFSGAIAKDWRADAVWPFFAHHLDLVIQTLRSPNPDYFFDRSRIFQAIGTLPEIPPPLVDVLFDLALGSAKNDRAHAQQALEGYPGKEARIVDALASGKGETRAVAAQWLGRLRHSPGVDALERAVLKEKHDVAKGEMLDALQALGKPVERYLDRDALVAGARKSLAKGVPAALDWFAWDALPEIRWTDTKQPVPREVLRWMLVQAVKQKSAEPNAILRKYCGMFEPRDRDALGQFVLEAWLREDVRPIPQDEAMKLAAANARSVYGYMQQSPQYFKDDPNFGRSVEELTAIYLPRYLRHPAGSAISTKGLLAIAAACAGERAVDPVARYLKEYYGTRAAQGKALIAMLAWIEHPLATQLMLSIGARFRTRSFQEEATRQAEALAERKGWSLAELADRTIPSAGFDERGVLELSYGPRTFTARLLPDMRIELFNPDGRKIAALPEPRQDDDAQLAKDSKKAYSAARKELKNIVQLQTDRLYEALCTERAWSFQDWSLYLNQHPIVRRLIQRLVWAQMEDGKVVRTFRPLDDGTLTDRDDNEVTLPPDARVRLAHDALLDADEVARWQAHLVDYEVTPLFQQLGKGTYVLPPDKAAQDSITDFEGHVLEAFALRGRAMKLGYQRGAAEDAGWFRTYHKRFPTLGLEATLEFTGNGLPEQNRTVALLSLCFYNSADKSWQQPKLALSKVPKVLLSECYNDVRLIAAEGAGYDPEWRKKTEY